MTKRKRKVRKAREWTVYTCTECGGEALYEGFVHYRVSGQLCLVRVSATLVREVLPRGKRRG